MAQLGQGRRFPHPFARPLEVPALRPPPLRRLFLPSPRLSLPPAPAAAPAPPPQRCPPPRPPPRGRHLWGELGGAARGQLALARSAPARSPPVRVGGGVGRRDGRGHCVWAWFVCGEGVVCWRAGPAGARGGPWGRCRSFRSLDLSLYWRLGSGLLRNNKNVSISPVFSTNPKHSPAPATV